MTLDAQTQATDTNSPLLAGAAEGQYVEPAAESDIEQEAVILDTNRIHKRQGHNPRRIRSKKEREEMRESIRSKGVLQSILVRPHPEKEGEFELVAGETRLDLSIEVGRLSIPALVRNLTDEEMLDYATTENVQRTDMSPVDEGMAAQELLAQGKDMEEVCLIMGWSMPFLQGRIQLRHCIDDVSQALVDEEIKLGHAQLLSSLREESQKNALAAILKNKMTVDQFREAINQLSLTLKAAAFDLTDCQTCPHNSSVQTSLFADNVSMGKAKCLNKECFDKKTTAHLDSVKADLAESHHKVAFSHEVAPGTTTVIVSTGSHGVGEEQANACQGCENFGATINSSMGSKAATTKNVCFNLKCHGEKVKAHRAVIATDTKPAAQKAEQKPATETGESKAPATGTSEKPKADKSKPEVKKPSVARSAIPRGIVAQHHNIHRKAAATTINTDEKAALILSLLCLMNEANASLDKKPKGWPTTLTGANRAKAAAMLDTLEMEQLSKLQRLMAAKALESSRSAYGGENADDTFGSVAVWVAKSRESDLTAHFKMDADYLANFTKPMVAERLEQSGFADQYDKDNGEKAFSKLVAGKKGDLIKEVEKSKFDFSGFLPEGLKLD